MTWTVLHGDPTHMGPPTQMPIGMAVAPLDLWRRTITGYQYSGGFVAKCVHPRHQGGSGCRKHRTCNAGQVLARGRPLGWLTATRLSSHMYPTGQEHKAPTACHLTLEERIGAREHLRLSAAMRHISWVRANQARR